MEPVYGSNLHAAMGRKVNSVIWYVCSSNNSVFIVCEYYSMEPVYGSNLHAAMGRKVNSVI